MGAINYLVMELKLYFSVFICILMMTSCGDTKRHTSTGTEDILVKKIVVNESDITKNEIGDFLILDSCIILSNQELFGEVNRMIIDGGYIYIMDNTSRIFCYDMSGNLVYKIDRRGGGPREYVGVADFGVDMLSDKLYVYDDQTRKMLIFNKQTGSYISDFSTQYMYPKNFAIADGTFFFSNDADYRVIDKENQNYFLLYSEVGKQIDNCFLPHDAVARYHFGSGDGHPFFYNEGKLLYNKMFDSRIYCLEKNQVTPLYDIVLPNQLPMKKIEDKMNHLDVVRSDYSYGVSNIFISGEIIHFIFSKDGFIQSCYYDIDAEQILFCGPRALIEPRELLPFYSLMQGVYNGHFFALISPTEMARRKETHPEFFGEDLKDIGADDNHVIAFYKAK